MLGGHLFQRKTWFLVAEFCLDDMPELALFIGNQEVNFFSIRRPHELQFELQALTIIQVLNVSEQVRGNQILEGGATLAGAINR
jgi:hypothetical protein